MTTLTIRPTGDNARYQQCSIYPASPTDHYKKVYEAVEDLTNYLHNTKSGEQDSTLKDSFDMADHTTESGDITSVTLSARAVATVVEYATGYIQLGFCIEGSDYWFTAFPLTSSDATYSHTWTVNPKTSAAWVWAEIDAMVPLIALRANVGADYLDKSGNPVSSSCATVCYQAWADVVYDPTAVTLDVLSMTLNPLSMSIDDTPDLPLLSISFGELEDLFPNNAKLPLLSISAALGYLSGHRSTAHPCVMSMFEEEPIDIQQVYVIGANYSGNLVYGQAENPSIIGAKFRLSPDDSITSTEDAEIVAENILYKSRLMLPRGTASFPTHGGLELLDVLEFDDDPANQASVSYRAGAIRLSYDRNKSEYRHYIALVSV